MIEPQYQREGVRLYLGDCLEILPALKAESIDAVITDPPYPEIARDYGRWTEAEWWTLIVGGVVPEVRRILNPTGSAVFILQPNSHKVGNMRGWLWEFMAWICREWNMVQDVWWWNTCPFPNVFCRRDVGLLRTALKACVWAGSPSCYRDQSSVLITSWEESKHIELEDNVLRRSPCSPKATVRQGRIKATIEERGGSTPQNVLPIGNASRAGISGHSAGTPLKLATWWTHYICPPNGVVLDPFIGSGTMGLAALQNGCSIIGIEKMPDYFDIAVERIEQVLMQPRLL